MIDYEILEKIEQTGSTNEKKEIFKEFCKNKTNVAFIQLAFNNIEYNVAKKTIDDALHELAITNNSWFAQEEPKDEQVIEDIKGLVKYSGGDLKRKIMGIFSDMNEEQKKWFRRAILHNLEMGFDVKLINNVFKDIGEEEVYYFQQPQLCGVIKLAKGESGPTSYGEPIFPPNFPEKFLAEQKFDGVRALISKKGDQVEIISRNGKVYRNFPKVVDAALQIAHDFTFDCEIIADEKGRAVENYQRLTTILQRIYFEGEEDFKIKCMVFDILELDGVDITSKTQQERRDILDTIVVDKPFEKTKAVLCDKGDVWMFFEEILNNGGEGLILKDLDKDYKFESRDRWWKLKNIIDGTFEVTGFGYGEGKTNKDKVAYLEINFEGKTNRVGSGITDEMADWMTENSGKLIGMKVDVQYSDTTWDNHLRFPRFIRFRDE